MYRRFGFIVAGTAISFMLAGLVGCGAVMGSHPNIALTQTNLGSNNFKVVTNGLTGTSSCVYILNIIPLNKNGLYKQAMDQIREKAKAIGRPVSMINITEDLSTVSYLVFSKTSLILTADAVEFTGND